MKLTKVRITEFQSIQDSTEFEIGDVTCLVGKNEAGKTAILKALYRLNPIIESDGNFDVTDDYPRRNVTDYQENVETQRRAPAQVVQATYELEADDRAAVEEIFGPKCLKGRTPTVTLKKGYLNKLTFSGLNMNSEATIKHLVEAAGIPQPLDAELLKKNTAEEMLKTLAATEQTEAVQKLTPMLQNISEHDVSYAAYNDIIQSRIPKFLYFDEYYQMKGQDNLDALKSRVANNILEESDHPLLGLIELARLDLNQIADPGRTETLIARIEAADMNQGPWRHLEDYTAAAANKFGRLWIIAGPVFEKDKAIGFIGEAEKGEVPVAVPHALFKVVIRETEGGNVDALAFLFPQAYEEDSAGQPSPLETWVNCSGAKKAGHVYDHRPRLTSVAKIEELTGLTFFPGVQNRIALRNTTPTALWEIKKKYWSPGGCARQNYVP